jgi:hypothetical protein
VGCQHVASLTFVPLLQLLLVEMCRLLQLSELVLREFRLPDQIVSSLPSVCLLSVRLEAFWSWQVGFQLIRCGGRTRRRLDSRQVTTKTKATLMTAALDSGPSEVLHMAAVASRDVRGRCTHDLPMVVSWSNTHQIFCEPDRGGGECGGAPGSSTGIEGSLGLAGTGMCGSNRFLSWRKVRGVEMTVSQVLACVGGVTDGRCAVGTWVAKFDAAAPEGGKQLIRIDACSEIGVQLLGCVIKIGMTWIRTERKLVMRQKKRGESRRFDGATG